MNEIQLSITSPIQETADCNIGSSSQQNHACCDTFRDNWTHGSLHDELCKVGYLRVVLYASGLFFPLNYFTGSWKIRLQRLWALFLRILIVFWSMLSATLATVYSDTSSGTALTILYSFCMITIVLQSLVLVPTFFVVSKKLNKPCLRIDVEHFTSNNVTCISVFVVSFVTGVLFPLYYIREAIPVALAVLALMIIFAEYAISVFLVATLLLVIVDVGVACALLEMLKTKFENQTLSSKLLNDVREEVQNRVSSSFLMTTAVVLVAILEILVLVLILLCSNLMTSVTDDDGDGTPKHPISITYVVLMALFFVKEVVFLFIVLWQSARVNEKSDRLIKLMGASSWKQTEMDCNVEEAALPLLVASQEKELLRQSLYINAESNRISMPLAFMRLKRRDVIIRFGLWGVSLVIGIIKAALDNGVTSVV